MSHSHLQVLPSRSSNTKLYDLNLLDTVFYVIQKTSESGLSKTLASFRILYIESFSLLNDIETS